MTTAHPPAAAAAATAQSGQVQRCTLTADSTGYRLQSCAHPERTLVLGFDGSIHVHDGAGPADAEGGQSLVVDAVAGIFELEYRRYVLVVTASERRGSVAGCDVYEVLRVAALPLDGAGSQAALSRAAKGHGSPEPAAAAQTGEADGPFGRMESRVVDETVRIFGSGVFYSYTYDLTRSLQAQSRAAAAVVNDDNDKDNEPLARIADRDYWFNRAIQQPLLDGGAEAWAVPLVQGSMQFACYEGGGSGCDVFDVCVLSRRNCRRPGLRYERRGANADGNVANFVETEQVLGVAGSGQPQHLASFVQTRGSVPFLWKQPAAGLHPVPVVTGTDEENAAVCAKHLQREIVRVGRQVLVNLVEHRGREAVIGAAYASVVGQCVAAETVDARQVRYVPWDFHHETRGLRHGALSQLIDQLRHEMDDMGYFWRGGRQTLMRQQGVFRVNCMDCLDRTNVVQSAIARCVLNGQLVRLGVHAAPDRGLAAYPGLDAVLCGLWATNGDYLSRQYAGTSAMKGDYTRTGKRNIGGILNDATYSVARLWNSTFRDYFSQAVIDFLMGSHRADAVFHTLVDLQSREPGHAQHTVADRAAAIEAAAAAAMDPSEQLHLACIVHPPLALDALKVRPSADAVLLVTDAAVIICNTGAAPPATTRIQLGALSRVQCGEFVTETRTPRDLDPERNHGLVLFFADTSGTPPRADGRYAACKLAGDAQVVMQHAPGPDGGLELARLESLEALPPAVFADCVCSTIHALALTVGSTAGSDSRFVVDAPIVDADAARQGASLVDKMATRLHSALWL
ncbi:hypothetical protein H4R19_003664 [Coemansia spiralis]|nr:hypothetical protein H4R19_003664 [Coemansia spiralis]